MNIQISFKGMESTEALKRYTEEKLMKHEELLLPATSITAELIQNVSTKGVKSDFEFDLNISLPQAVVRVQERGEDMYANIDRATDVLARKLKRYFDKRENWDGITPWSEIEAQENFVDDIEEVPDNYMNYVPKIAARFKLEDMTPMPEAQAIERMELLGDTQILFKNSQTGKISMIYKNMRGQYCLVEPADTL